MQTERSTVTTPGGGPDVTMRDLLTTDTPHQPVHDMRAGRETTDVAGQRHQTREVDPACAARRHGDARAYNYDKCRCPSARADANRRRCENRHRAQQGPALIPSLGTTRRLRALNWIGWPTAELSARTGLHPSHLDQMMRSPRTHVLRTTADIITVIYQRLSWQHGPSRKSTTHAQRHGWMPPSYWPDDQIDEPHYQPSADDPQPVMSLAAEHAEIHAFADLVDIPGGVAVGYTAELGWHFILDPDPLRGIPLADDDPPLAHTMARSA